MALSTRNVVISLRFPTNQASATVSFIPDLASGDGQVLLEETYTVTLTTGAGTTTLSGTKALPVKSSGYIAYRVKFPKETGYNEHYIYLEKGDNSDIDLATLVTLAAVQGADLALTDLTDVTISSPSLDETLTYDGTKWVNAPGGGSSSTITAGTTEVASGGADRVLFEDGDEKLGTAVEFQYDSANADLLVDTAKIGAISGYPLFAHTDNFNLTDYAILQTSSGDTIFNAKAGQALRFRLNNSDTNGMNFDGTNWTIGYDSSNKMSMTCSSNGVFSMTAYGDDARFSFNADAEFGGTVTGTNIASDSLKLDFALLKSTSTNLAGPTADQTLVSVSAAIYRSVRYLVQVTENSDVHVTEIRVFHDGTDCYIGEYGIMYTSGSLATFSVKLEDGQIQLLASPTSGTKNFKVLTQALKA